MTDGGADWSIRDATAGDQSFVTRMQYEALFVPPGADAFARSVLDEPGIRPYHESFGRRPGDVGRIAVDHAGRPVGAAWSRIHRGYGFVSDGVPELGIAVVAEARERGVGTALLCSLLEAVPEMSLAVDRRNPARRLYERLGFVTVRREGDSLVMVRRP